MFTARKKIVKDRGVEPDELEEQVAQVKGNSVSFRPHRCCNYRLAGCT